MTDAPITRIWDLPTRLFHWLLVLLVTLLWVTGEFGGMDLTLDIPGRGETYLSNMDIHALAGQAVLGLLMFRLMWGFWGSSTARFAHFLHSPRVIWDKVRELLQGKVSATTGHNPLGGVMVVLFIVALGLQSVSGLFSADDLFFQGPLSHLVEDTTVETLTGFDHLLFSGLKVLIILHLLAIGYYFLRGHNLITAMLTGKRRLYHRSDLYFASMWRFLLSLGLACGLLIFIRSL